MDEYIRFEGCIEPLIWGSRTYTVRRLPDEVARRSRKAARARVEGENRRSSVNLALSRAPVTPWDLSSGPARACSTRSTSSPGDLVEVRLRPAPTMPWTCRTMSPPPFVRGPHRRLGGAHARPAEGCPLQTIATARRAETAGAPDRGAARRARRLTRRRSMRRSAPARHVPVPPCGDTPAGGRPGGGRSRTGPASSPAPGPAKGRQSAPGEVAVAHTPRTRRGPVSSCGRAYSFLRPSAHHRHPDGTCRRAKASDVPAAPARPLPIPVALRAICAHDQTAPVPPSCSASPGCCPSSGGHSRYCRHAVPLGGAGTPRARALRRPLCAALLRRGDPQLHVRRGGGGGGGCFGASPTKDHRRAAQPWATACPSSPRSGPLLHRRRADLPRRHILPAGFAGLLLLEPGNSRAGGPRPRLGG